VRAPPFPRSLREGELADHGQLIAEVRVDRFEPIWQSHGGKTLASVPGNVSVRLHVSGVPTMR
jgi:hypothetical protein